MSDNKIHPRDWIRGARLRAIRENVCGLSLQEAAKLVEWHGSKLSRTERGQRPVTIEDFAMLITAWGVPARQREEILSELSTSTRTGWWDRPIPGVPNDVGTLAAYESEARELVSVSVSVVPGLLHTYPTAVATLSAYGVQPADIATRWMARLQRQQVLTRLDFTAYITEHALRTPWGGHDNHRDQLTHLLRSDEIGYKVRVIPNDQTEVVLLHTWQWMGFGHTPPVVHAELETGAVFVHEAETYTELVQRLDRVALPQYGSRKLISGIMEGARS